ncbi:hypothetical protein LTR08_003261 [Meristemomyces frigidus]|nr:hypothetical protein LTR08_003261 [Meristemomyces frigidus]
MSAKSSSTLRVPKPRLRSPQQAPSHHSVTSHPTDHDRHRTVPLALSPLHLLLPLPAVTAVVEAQDWTGQHQKAYRLPLLALLPFYCLEQVKYALVHHVRSFGDAHAVQRSQDAAAAGVRLRECLSTLYVRPDARVPAPSAVCWRTCAFVVGRNTFQAEGVADFEGALLVGSLVWLELTQGNLMAILKALAGGKGRLVVRFWPSPSTASERRKREREKRKRRQS